MKTLLNELKESYNPNFNDAGVKKAVQGWEDYAARESDDQWTEAEDRDLDEIAKEGMGIDDLPWDVIVPTMEETYGEEE